MIEFGRMRVAVATIALLAQTLVHAAEAGGSCRDFRWVTLGTAGGPLPMYQRSEPANLLVAGDQMVMVDAGDGAADQLSEIGVKLGAIHQVFISHHHLDHTGGLAAVIGLRWMNQYPGVLTVYGPPGTKAIVDGILATMGPQSKIGFSVGAPPPPPADSVAVVELKGGDHVELGPLSVKAVENTHFYPESDKGPRAAISLSYRFELGGRSIVYTGDTGPSDAVTRLADKSDMLVSEVIDLDRAVAGIRKARPDAAPELLANMQRHLSTHHMQPTDIGVMATKAGVGHLVLTHFAIPGPLFESEPGFRSEIRKNFAGPVDLARDLQSFDVGCK